MFICSVTLTKERIALLLALFLILLLVLGTLTSFLSAERLLTNQGRRQFLTDQGLHPAKSAYQIEAITLPTDFDTYLSDYEVLQQSQGLSLLPYGGKRVKKYTYRIAFPDYDKPVYANLLLYRGVLIACDLTCPDFQDGWIRPLLQTTPEGAK